MSPGQARRDARRYTSLCVSSPPNDLLVQLAKISLYVSYTVLPTPLSVISTTPNTLDRSQIVLKHDRKQNLAVSPSLTSSDR